MEQHHRVEHMTYQDRLLLRPREVAAATGLSRSMVYELIGRGELPSIRFGKSVRVPVAELQQWIRDQATAQRTSPHQS